MASNEEYQQQQFWSPPDLSLLSEMDKWHTAYEVVCNQVKNELTKQRAKLNEKSTLPNPDSESWLAAEIKRQEGKIQSDLEKHFSDTHEGWLQRQNPPFYFF